MRRSRRESERVVDKQAAGGAVMRLEVARLIEERSEPTRVPRLWSARALAARWGMSRAQVYKLMNTGKLPAFTIFKTKPGSKGVRRATEAAVRVRVTGTGVTKATALLPVETVEIGFVQTRAVLMKRLEARKQTAAPAPIAALEQTLSTMDSAIRDIHAALERDPYNSSLLFKLSHTRRRELRLLQQVIL